MIKIIIIGLIWDGLGDYILTKYIYDSIKEYLPDIFFIMKDKNIQITNKIQQLLNNIFHKYKFIRYKDLIKLLKDYTFIFLTSSSYNFDNVYEILCKYYSNKLNNYRRIFDFGISDIKYYKPSKKIFNCKIEQPLFLQKKHIYYNIYTGFSKNSLGLLINIPIPKKNIINLFDDYDIYTCYYRTDKYIIRFIEFINIYTTLQYNIDKKTSKSKLKKSLIFIQGNNFFLNNFIFYKIHDNYTIYKYKNCYIISSFVSLNQSIELIYYSNLFVGCQGNLSFSFALNYNKIPLLEWRENIAQSYCLMRDFLNENSFEKILYFITFLYYKKNITKKNIEFYINSIIQYKNIFIKFYSFIHKNYSLNKNFSKYFKKMIKNNIIKDDKISYSVNYHPFTKKNKIKKSLKKTLKLIKTNVKE